MKEFDEMLKKLKALSIIQTSNDWVEDIPQDLWEKYMKHKGILIDENIDTIHTAKFSISMSVYEYYGRYLGVQHVTFDAFKRSDEDNKTNLKLKFYEMKKESRIVYKVKKMI